MRKSHQELRSAVALAKHPSGVRDQGCALPKIQERTLLLFCPEQGGWQTGEWLHDRQSWVSIADIEVVLESILWTEAPPEPLE